MVLWVLKRSVSKVISRRQKSRKVLRQSNLIQFFFLFQISIKNQEQVLQTEIDDIAAKFHSLLESCGLQPESGTMAPPSTPSFMKTHTSSLTHVTNLDTPTFLKTKSGLTTTEISDLSDDDTDFIIAPVCSLAESEATESDEILHDISSKTLIVDNNFNYLDSNSEVTDNTPIIEALPSMEENSTSSNSLSPSSGRMSSDGYPKSDDSSDNQIVPECYDLDKEFMSRLQYYSDFTLDRQKKINSMVSHLGPLSKEDITSADTEELFTRHVEGAESPASPIKITMKPAVSSRSSSDNKSTPSHQRPRRERSHRHSRSSRKSNSNPLASSTRIEDCYSSSSSGRRSHASSSLVPRASSTMIDDTFSMSSGSSGRRNRTSGSNPRACSTMLNESFLSSGSSNSHGSSRQRSSSIPVANSTMISDINAVVPSIIEPSASLVVQARDNHSDDDLESIYTWSIHDDDGGSDTNMNLEQSYMRNITNSQRKAMNSNKPPLPPCKRVRSGSVSSRDSDTSNKVCQDHNLHKLLGETCSKNILATISAIEPNATCRDENLLVESMYDDDEYALPRANTLPRSSTKMNLKDKSGGSSSSAKVKDKSSGSSSMEAKRASLPDLYSVSVVDDFHSVPESIDSDSDDDDISVLPERMQCPGKSSSSGDKDSSLSQLESSATPLSTGQEVVKDSLIDSILTDSPNSVSSGGINAPHNSPGTNCSSSSKVSCSTTSDAKSSDSNVNSRAPPAMTVLPRNITESPKVQNINLPHAAGDNVFKVPKQTQPLRKLFRFRRNKSKTPDMKITVPRQEPTIQHCDPQSKRELFPNGASNISHEPKIVDKKAVIKKFKKFSDNFHKRDRSGKVKIQTLANL